MSPTPPPREPDFTLAAGPTTASARTPAALGSSITYHDDPVFLEAVLGLEAAARSLVRPGMHVLNLVSGVFGTGMGYWLKGLGAELHEIEVPDNESVDPAAVGRFLDAHPEIELLTVVHSETPPARSTTAPRSVRWPVPTAW